MMKPLNKLCSLINRISHSLLSCVLWTSEEDIIFVASKATPPEEATGVNKLKS